VVGKVKEDISRRIEARDTFAAKEDIFVRQVSVLVGFIEHIASRPIPIELIRTSTRGFQDAFAIPVV